MDALSRIQTGNSSRRVKTKALMGFSANLVCFSRIVHDFYGTKEVVCVCKIMGWLSIFLVPRVICAGVSAQASYAPEGGLGYFIMSACESLLNNSEGRHFE